MWRVTCASTCRPARGAHVLKRIHGGIGRFWRAFRASFFLMMKRFCDGCRRMRSGAQVSGVGRAGGGAGGWHPGPPVARRACVRRLRRASPESPSQRRPGGPVDEPHGRRAPCRRRRRPAANPRRRVPLLPPPRAPGSNTAKAAPCRPLRPLQAAQTLTMVPGAQVGRDRGWEGRRPCAPRDPGARATCTAGPRARAWTPSTPPSAAAAPVSPLTNPRRLARRRAPAPCSVRRGGRCMRSTGAATRQAGVRSEGVMSGCCGQTEWSAANARSEKRACRIARGPGILAQPQRQPCRAAEWCRAADAARAALRGQYEHTPLMGPRMRRASCMSLGTAGSRQWHTSAAGPPGPCTRAHAATLLCSLMVTRLAWMAQRLQSSSRCTMKSSVASCSASSPSAVHRNGSGATLLVISRACSSAHQRVRWRGRPQRCVAADSGVVPASGAVPASDAAAASGSQFGSPGAQRASCG